MKRYLVLYGIGGLLDDYKEVEGKSAPDALSRHFANDLALYKRASIERSNCHYILREFTERDGRRFWKGPRVGVQRLQPKIVKLRRAL